MRTKSLIRNHRPERVTDNAFRIRADRFFDAGECLGAHLRIVEVQSHLLEIVNQRSLGKPHEKFRLAERIECPLDEIRYTDLSPRIRRQYPRVRTGRFPPPLFQKLYF